MRSSLKIFTLIFVLLMLFGCEGKKENFKEFVKTCELTSNDVTNGYKLKSLYEIHGKGKTVEKVITTETVTSDDEETLEYFKEYLSTTYESYNKIYGGYTNEITISDGKLISKTTIDYSKMNLEKFASDNSVIKNYVNDDNKFLLEGIKSFYKSLGANCEK